MTEIRKHYFTLYHQHTIHNTPLDLSTGLNFVESILEICDVVAEDEGQYICNTAASGITRNTTITITVLEAVTARNKDVFYECVGGGYCALVYMTIACHSIVAGGVVEASYSQALPSFTVQCHPFFS